MASGNGKLLRSRVLSASRTGLACLLATVLLQYAEGYVRWTSFSVFAFILALLIVGEPGTTLGNAVLDAWSVFVGGVQGLLLAMLVLNASGAYIPMWSSIAGIFCCSMVIAYTSFTSLLSKRIALTVASHLFTIAYFRQDQMHRVYYPLRLGCTMLLGIGCALVALAFPLPRTASRKVQQQIVESTQAISSAFSISLDAFCCHNKKKGVLLWHRAQFTAKEASRLISDIQRLYLVGSRVELQCTPLSAKQAIQSFGKRLRKFMLHLNTMQRSSEFFTEMWSSSDDDLLKDISQVRDWSSLAFKFVGASKPKQLQNVNLVIHEGDIILKKLDETSKALVQRLEAGNIDKITLMSCISFLYNTKLFVTEVQSMLNDVYRTPNTTFLSLRPHPKVAALGGAPNENPNPPQEAAIECPTCSKDSSGDGLKGRRSLRELLDWLFKLDLDRFILSFKISAAISLSAFLGFMYDRKHAYWATLIVGMGYRTFTVASIHGVVLGTIYGYLLSFWTHQHPFISVAALLPLIVFVTFIKTGKFKQQYSYMGNTAVMIGAIFLIGHRHKVQLNDFAMARITHGFLGLASYVLMENLIFPRHPSTLAREKVVSTLDELQKCFRLCIGLDTSGCKTCFGSTMEQLVKSMGQLESTLATVDSLVDEASSMEAEQAKLFAKVVKAESQMVGILHFVASWHKSSSSRSLREFEGLASTLASLVAPLQRPDVESQISSSSSSSSKAVDIPDYIWADKFHQSCVASGEQDVLALGALVFHLRIFTVEASKLETHILKLAG